MIRDVTQLLLMIFPSDQRWKIVLFERWGDIIGKLREHARIEKLHEKTLTIGVSHPAWAQELHMLSSVLKKKINAALGCERIETIRFQVTSNAQVSQRATLGRLALNQQRASLKKTDHATLSASEAKALASFHDTPVHEHMIAYLTRCKNFWSKYRKE